ncbi:AraC family transcriptional regulator [Empedobacter falsenii]
MENVNKLFIKNMVCHRCKVVVGRILKKNAIEANHIELGEVELTNPIDSEKLNQIKEELEEVGFELIDDKRSKLIEQIKTLIIQLVHQENSELKVNLSDFLSEKTSADYKYISNLFSEMEGQTIEKYFIQQKIEKVKELMVYDELSLSEIAFQLNYSSVAHLSAQFKKVTGLTPSVFKQLSKHNRKSIDKI